MPGAQKLSPLDASFLHLETRHTHMHIGGVAIFEPSPYSPASRLFLNEVYLDLERIPELVTATGGDRVLERIDVDQIDAR